MVVDNLSVSYGTGHHRSPPVLRDLSFEVLEAERLVLLGLNGAGKTTTLAALAGLLRPDRGSIIFAGQDITDLSAAERVALGITLVPEGRQVFPGLTVDQNLRLGAWMHRHDDPLRRRDPRPGPADLPAARPAGVADWPARSRAGSSRCWPSAGR